MSLLLVMHNTKTGSVCGLLRVSHRLSISMHVFGEGCGSKSAYIAFYISLRDYCVIDADEVNDANLRDTDVCDANFCDGDLLMMPMIIKPLMISAQPRALRLRRRHMPPSSP